MRLYYFTTAEHGLMAIRDRRLKIAEINKLNDPFEFLAMELPTKEWRSILNSIKGNVSHDIGLLCMSSTWHHPLMWSHYSNKHRGICLGFEVEYDDSVQKVEYIDYRYSLKEIGVSAPSNFNVKHMGKLINSKFSAWSYESEYRMHCILKNRDPVNDLYFQPFSDKIKLKEVIVGFLSDVTKIRIKKILGNEKKSVSIIKATPSSKEFKIEADTRASAWK